MRLFNGDDQLIIRKARKQWVCNGNGAAGDYKRRSSNCVIYITPGLEYVECRYEARAFEQGTCVCMSCAKEFYKGVTHVEA